MKDCYFLKDGELFVRKNFSLDPEIERKEISVEHLITRPISKEYDLLIDTFNDKIEIVPVEVKQALFEKRYLRGEGEINKAAAFYANLFEKEINKLRKKRADSIEAWKKSLNITFCPTFACNLNCSYCFQKSIKDLNKKIISDEDLQFALNWMRKKIDEVRKENVPVNNLTLFGGEPLQKGTKNVISKIFQFIRSVGIKAEIFSNGVEIPYFAPLLLEYQDCIAGITVTLDVDKEIHNSKRLSVINSYDQIVDNINFLVDNKITTNIGVRVDKNNLPKLTQFFEMSKKYRWADHPCVYHMINCEWDKFDERREAPLLREGSLLSHIFKLKNEYQIPLNTFFHVNGTARNVSRHLDFFYRITDDIKRTAFGHCGVHADYFYVIDAELNYYYCRPITGRKGYVSGSIKEESSIKNTPNPRNSKLLLHNSLDNSSCYNCPIGGWCEGRCFVSYEKKREKVCEDEFMNMETLISDVLIPEIEKMMNPLQNSEKTGSYVSVC